MVVVELERLKGMPASRSSERDAAGYMSTGIPEVDSCCGGYPRGAITEIIGPPSSGRTSLFVSSLAAATLSGEAAALVDVTGAFDPGSAKGSGAVLERLLWVQCQGDALRGLRAAELILQCGLFTLVGLDLSDVPIKDLQRIPLAKWIRLRRLLEDSPTCLVLISQRSIASGASLVLEHYRGEAIWAEAVDERPLITTTLLKELNLRVEQRKPFPATVAGFRYKHQPI